MKNHGRVPVLIPFLIMVSMLFIGLLIYVYVETKKANPQMIRVGEAGGASQKQNAAWAGSFDAEAQRTQRGEPQAKGVRRWTAAREGEAVTSTRRRGEAEKARRNAETRDGEGRRFRTVGRVTETAEGAEKGRVAAAGANLVLPARFHGFALQRTRRENQDAVGGLRSRATCGASAAAGDRRQKTIVCPTLPGGNAGRRGTLWVRPACRNARDITVQAAGPGGPARTRGSAPPVRHSRREHRARICGGNGASWARTTVCAGRVRRAGSGRVVRKAEPAPRRLAPGTARA